MGSEIPSFVGVLLSIGVLLLVLATIVTVAYFFSPLAKTRALRNRGEYARTSDSGGRVSS